MRVEPALALVDELDGAEAPRPEQRRDARRPRPLAHAVEALAVLDVVAVDELLVREQVAVRVDDALGQPGRAATCSRAAPGRRRACPRARRRRRRLEAARRRAPGPARPAPASTRSALAGVGDQHLRLRVADPVADAVVAVEHRHREQDRAALPRAEERRRGLGRRRQQHRHPVALLRRRGARSTLAKRLESSCSSPHLTSRTVPSKCSWIIASLSAGCLSQTSCGDVVALGDAPLVGGDGVFVGRARRRAHGSSSRSSTDRTSIGPPGQASSLAWQNRWIV